MQSCAMSAEFDYIRKFLSRKIGLHLGDDKDYLVRVRARSVLTEHGLDDLGELVRLMRRDAGSIAVRQFLDAMTTNETLFFRDGYPFDALSELILPGLAVRGRSDPVRLWSAAASTGQEAYSMAMCASDCFADAGRRVRVFGSDCSALAIRQAREGVYTSMQIHRGLPEQKLKRFFEPHDGRWKVRFPLQQMVHFEQANLVCDDLVAQMRPYGPFDVVFCRHVLIYFSLEERSRVIDRIARCMCPGGFLITSAAETPIGRTTAWDRVMFQGKRLWRLRRVW